MPIIELMLAPIVIYCITHYFNATEKENQNVSFRKEDQQQEKRKMSIKIRPERI